MGFVVKLTWENWLNRSSQSLEYANICQDSGGAEMGTDYKLLPSFP